MKVLRSMRTARRREENGNEAIQCLQYQCSLDPYVGHSGGNNIYAIIIVNVYTKRDKDNIRINNMDFIYLADWRMRN